ncbi:MAG TPA: L-threonylcarbamoyladenylate synthase [Candidatus Babeliales bacterium]|nr:L-threonylcarbamoyladenylate synthase [Candidatus Babeliales bacterium]
MDKIYQWDTKQGYIAVRNALLNGYVVLADSDTVVGLLALCSCQGFGHLNAIKERQDKPYIIVVGSLAQAWEYAIAPQDPGIKRLIHCWPGPLTLLLYKNTDNIHYIPQSYKKVALRIPDHEPLRQLADACGGLFSTSANKTGMPTPERIELVDSSIKEQVACIMQSEEKNLVPQASTILDCTVDPVKVIREGAYPIEILKRIYGKSFA